MNYTLNQLQVFLKVTQLKSVTKAAEELHLTQPAVSIQLRNFQDQFDIPLTEVIGRQLYVTDFGKEIAVAADDILNQVYAINHKTLAYRNQLAGRLKISVVSTGKYVMPYFLTGFMKKHVGIELAMDVTNKARVIKSLEQNEVDMSLVSLLPDNLKVDQLDLLSNELYLVGNEAKASTVPEKPKTIFDKLPLIYREKGSGTRQTMERYLAAHNVPTLKKMELTSNEAVKQAVLAGLGYSIMPLIGMKKELADGSLHIIPVNGLPITTTWSLIWLQGKKHSPVAKAFLAHLSENKRETVEEIFR